MLVYYYKPPIEIALGSIFRGSGRCYQPSLKMLFIVVTSVPEYIKIITLKEIMTPAHTTSH